MLEKKKNKKYFYTKFVGQFPDGGDDWTLGSLHQRGPGRDLLRVDDVRVVAHLVLWVYHLDLRGRYDNFTKFYNFSCFKSIFLAKALSLYKKNVFPYLILVYRGQAVDNLLRRRCRRGTARPTLLTPAVERH